MTPRDDEGRFTRDEERAADRAVNELLRRGRRVRAVREQTPGDREMNDWIRGRGRSRPAQPEQHDEEDAEQREPASAPVSAQEREERLRRESRELSVRVLADKLGMRRDAIPAAVALLD